LGGFPREAPWLLDFENELFGFPNNRYDDQVDALFQALIHARLTYLWDDAALKGFERFTNRLVRRLLERTLRGYFEFAVNFVIHSLLWFKRFPVPRKTGNYGITG